jgi:hypothetical protein
MIELHLLVRGYPVIGVLVALALATYTHSANTLKELVVDIGVPAIPALGYLFAVTPRLHEHHPRERHREKVRMAAGTLTHVAYLLLFYFILVL